jgi:hypothetical protein
MGDVVFGAHYEVVVGRIAVKFTDSTSRNSATIHVVTL